LLVVLGAYLGVVASIAATMTGQALDETLFSNPELFTSIPFIALAVVGYLVWAIVLNVVIRLYLVRDLWQRVVSSITVHG
ncbi:hypothetical protein, partial [Klebsiella aerogenes]|uniref:hypothetical protein n=1 Tax=Klebsiella aerogenes TaxID=548 RepID=UPI001953C033